MFVSELKCRFFGSRDIISSGRCDFTLKIFPQVLNKLFVKDVLPECYGKVSKLEDQILILKNIDIEYNINRNVVFSMEKDLDNIDTDE